MFLYLTNNAAAIIEIVFQCKIRAKGLEQLKGFM